MGILKNLFFVRHGESEGNLVRDKYEEVNNESIYSDKFLKLHESQYSLTQLGVDQSKKAGEWFFKNNFIFFDKFIVSNNVRAMQTAINLGFQNAKWIIDFNLRERDGGLFKAITPTNRDLNYLDEQIFHDTQPFLFRPPQGESLADLCLRVKPILDALEKDSDIENVIIVCHARVMRTSKIIFEEMSIQTANEYLSTSEEWGRVPNCSIIQYTKENPFVANQDLSKNFDWVRIIRPAGGGEFQDPFVYIDRKKYSNDELLLEINKMRQLS